MTMPCCCNMTIAELISLSLSVVAECLVLCRERCIDPVEIILLISDHPGPLSEYSSCCIIIQSICIVHGSITILIHELLQDGQAGYSVRVVITLQGYCQRLQALLGPQLIQQRYHLGSHRLSHLSH